MSIDVSLNGRILNIYELLRHEGKVKSKAEFCRSLNLHTPSFAKVETNERTFPRSKFQLLSNTYGVSPEYLTVGKGPVFATAQPIKKTINVSKICVVQEDAKTIVTFIDENGLENVLNFNLRYKYSTEIK